MEKKPQKKPDLLVIERRVMDDLLHAISILHQMIEKNPPCEENLQKLEYLAKLLKSCNDSKIIKL
jgi:hypothetical protein